MWKAEVIADNSGKWCGNALLFATQAEAEKYARDLAYRWTAVRQWRVVEVPDDTTSASVMAERLTNRAILGTD